MQPPPTVMYLTAAEHGMDDLVVNDFTMIESVYGKFIVNRHCHFQAEALIKTGRPHIESELAKILAIADTLPEGCTIIDAGANIGLVSIPLAQKLRGKGGTVLAFEPQVMLFYALCGAAALNDLQNLQVHNWALGATPGNIAVPRLDYSKTQDFGTLSLAAPIEGALTRTVPLQTIDGLGQNRLDFLKIDVEGMEIDVLRGGRALIRENLPWCWIEYWKVDIDHIKAEFADLPYKFYLMDTLNLLCAPVERLAETGITVKASEV